jgi:hypothetical protein
MLKREILSAAIALAFSGAALADTVYVTDAGDGGANTFRAAVEAANADPAIDTIMFTSPLSVMLQSEVHYTGSQDLTIAGNDSALTGDCPLASTWDGGLFASYSAAAISVSDISFADSCNNGVGIFIPEDASGEVAITLDNVSITGSRFHGLYADNQDSTGVYNTDDVPHPDCQDPHPYDSKAGIVLYVTDSSIDGNGTVGLVSPAPNWIQPAPIDCEADELELTGCPYDFDGIRLDDGGQGGIAAYVWDSSASGNLADGIEYDELDQGGVLSWAWGLVVAENGETTANPIFDCDGDNVEDLDDGFDIDEEDNGELYAYFENIVVVDNRDEGLDLDEAGNGSATVVVDGAVANGNEDQGIKVDESDNGSLYVTIIDAEVNDSLSQHGTEFTEEDNGSLDVVIADSDIKFNDDGAVAGEQTGKGYGLLTVIDSDLTGNDECSFEELDDSIDVDLQGTTVIDVCP